MRIRTQADGGRRGIARSVVADGALGAVFATTLLAGCGSREAIQTGRAQVDTLEGGRVLVSNADVASEDGAFRILVASEIGSRTGDGPEAFADVSSLAADRSRRLYVVDSGANEIRVFDSGNGYVARFGRQGSGPGELLWSGVRVSLSIRNLLWIVDPPSLRMVDSLGRPLGRAFQGIDFSAGRGNNADTVGFAYAARTFPDGGPPDLTPDYIVKYGRSESGNAVAVDSLSLPQLDFEFRVARAEGGIAEIEFLPMQPEIVWAVAPGGTIWIANTSEYLLHELAMGGDTLRTVALERDPRPFEGRHRDSLAELTGFPADQLPADLPFMDRIDVAPGGYLWVRQPRTPQRQAWDIFDDRGHYLGPAFSEVPLDDYPLRVTGPRTAVGVRRDAFGVEYVVRLELRPPDDEH